MAAYRKLIVVIDALSALQGGGRTYLINLFKFFPSRLSSSVKVIALLPKGSESTFLVGSHIECIFPDFPSRGIVFRILWGRFMLPRLLKRLGADVLFCPGGFVSAFGPWRTAVTFQNMLPFSPEERRRYPLGYTRARLAILRWVQGRSFRRADLVIFISDFAKSVIDIVVGERDGSSVVIPHGISDVFRNPSQVSTFREPMVFPFQEKYVSYVSILNVYKAQMEVVKAWDILRKRRAVEEKLVLVGPAFDHYAKKVRSLIRDLGLEGDVIIAGDVPYADLPKVYRNATINIFASSCENCPFILLEALASGRPLICSDYQPMPEFASDSVVYFDPYSPETLANQLEVVLSSQQLQVTLGKRAYQRSLIFEWSKSVDATWDALSSIGEKSGGISELGRR